MSQPRLPFPSAAGLPASQPGLPFLAEAGLRPMIATDLGALLVGDCLDHLRAMPDDCVDLVVTSPPYDEQPRYDDGQRYARDWYEDTFMKVTGELRRVLKPAGSFVLNYRSKRHNGERGVLQYELVFWLRDQGWNFAEDFVWGKPSPPPGRWNRHLKDAVEYCFQFTKTRGWDLFPDQCLTEARWDRRDVERRKKLKHNFDRVNEPGGHGRRRVQAGPDRVRPSTLLSMEPEFLPNPAQHPARFPVGLPGFFIRLLTPDPEGGAQALVYDPFAGTGTTGVAAEGLGRRWLLSELQAEYATVLPDRLLKGR